MRAALPLVLLALSLSACSTFDGGSAKDQHRTDPVCLTGASGDRADFAAILAEDGMPGVPECSDLVDADAVGTITRAKSDEDPRQIRVRFVLKGRDGATLVDLSSTGSWPEGESADAAAHRLIKRDWNLYVPKIGMVKW